MAVMTLSLLRQADLDTFWRDGFVHQRDVFTGEQLAALRHDLNALSGWAAVLAGEGDVIGALPWLTAEVGRYFTPVENLAARSAVWRDVCDGVLHVGASQLLDAPAVFEHATGIIKPPVIGLTFPLHQDGVYYSPPDGRCVCANVYLDDVRPDNGSILFAPGSHAELWPHDTAHGKKALTDPDRWFPGLVTPQAQAGDVVWFHLWTVHGSQPNVSPYCRRAVRVGYIT